MFKFDSAKGLKGGTKFQAKWLLDDQYKPWLQKVDGNLFKSYCKLCDTLIMRQWVIEQLRVIMLEENILIC